jgi:Spy/CpxP family protein refolding chaperone
MCVVACLTLAVATTAMAQQGQGRRGGGFGMGGGQTTSAQLLAVEKVQDDLKLTADQKDKITALRMEGRGAGGGRQGRGQNASPEERAAALKAAQERDAKFDELLNADQKKRLGEIKLQARGNSALNDEAVAKELALTDSQKASVKTISDAVAKKIMDLGPPQQGGDFAARAREVNDIRTGADPEYLAVLTAEQKTKFTAMQGAKIDGLAAAIQAGGRGGRGRRGNNN